jgi:DNA-binding response OmpR family regulator
MNQSRILVVDDDDELLELLRIQLEAAHYQVDTARDGQQALRSLETSMVDLMILDVHLPLLDGLSVCRKVRTFSQLPILMLSSQRDELDKVVGLEVGADDYLGKPYHPRELMARVRALLRRARLGPTEATVLLEAGGLELDMSCHQARDQGKPLALTPIELNLLEALLRNLGKTVTRAQLLQTIWGRDFDGSSRTLDTHMRNLRLKLSSVSPRIESVRGLGYKLMVRTGQSLLNLDNSLAES